MYSKTSLYELFKDGWLGYMHMLLLLLHARIKDWFGPGLFGVLARIRDWDRTGIGLGLALGLGFFATACLFVPQLLAGWLHG